MTDDESDDDNKPITLDGLVADLRADIDTAIGCGDIQTVTELQGRIGAFQPASALGGLAGAIEQLGRYRKNLEGDSKFVEETAEAVWLALGLDDGDRSKRGAPPDIFAQVRKTAQQLGQLQPVLAVFSSRFPTGMHGPTCI